MKLSASPSGSLNALAALKLNAASSVADFDDVGSFDNPDRPRGTAAQVGNLKTVSFTTPVFVASDAVLSLSGVASGDLFRVDKLTFTRVESPNSAPTAVVIDAALVDENAAGAVIGQLSSSDPDGDSAQIVFSTEETRFEVTTTGALKLVDGVSLDFEAGATATVSVTATDAQGAATTTELSLAVTDLNEAPTLAEDASLDDVTLETGVGASIPINGLGASDVDAGPAPVYDLRGAGGAAVPAGFAIVGGALVVPATAPEGVYAIEVIATDGELDSESAR